MPSVVIEELIQLWESGEEHVTVLLAVEVLRQ
jgi:hypothetical protein